MEKQKLLFHQSRLACRGVYEMVLQFVSACKGVQSEMVTYTLELGISILRGGNLEIQKVILYSLRQATKLAPIMPILFLANAQLFEREKRCRLLHFNCWTDELVQVTWT